MDHTITRDEVLKRAAFWLNNRDIHYSQSDFATNALGNFYRTDCSGFVSMAFAIRDNPNTVSFPQRLTAIRYDQLKPGDVLGVLGEGTGGDNGHITLFVKWDDAAHTSVTTWEHGGWPDWPNEEHHVLADWNHPVGDGVQSYRAYRYNQIVDDPGPKPETGVAVVRDGTRYHVFTVEPDGTASQRIWDGVWHQPENLGGVVTGTPAVLFFPDSHRFELYAIGTDGRLRQHIYNGMWLAWQPVQGGSVRGGLSAVAAHDGARHLMAVNGAGTVYQRISRGTWSDWQPIDGVAHGTPGLLYHFTSRDRYDLFATDSQGHVVQKIYLDGIWRDWGGTVVGSVLPGVAACRDPTGGIHLFARGADRTLRHATYNGSWSSWQGFAGELSCLPTAVAEGNRIDLFAKDVHGALVQKTRLAKQWFDWRRI